MLSQSPRAVLSPEARASLRNVLELHAASATAMATTSDGGVVQYEVELRAGRVDGSNRNGGGGGGGPFVSGIDAWYFYAVFEALYARGDAAVSAKSFTTHVKHDTLLRQELDVHGADSGGETWTRKSVVAGCQHTHNARANGACWFDVRISLAKEERLGNAAAAAAAAAHSVQAYGNDAKMRVRTRRTVRLPRVAPHWRIDFTHVATHFSQRTRTGIEDTFEVEFELEAPGDDGDTEAVPVDQLIDEAEALARCLRDAIAGSETAMRTQIYRSMHGWEQRYSYQARQ